MKERVVIKYYESMKSGHGFHRYNSWEHCYREFSKISKATKKELDYLALHLAAYLASWGMYRGSAFLLEFDYKVHEEVVKLILKHKRNLHGLEVKDFLKRSDEVMILHQEICNYYDLTLETYKKAGITKPVKTSEVLSTKIMLGTLGCIPAYDRFLKIGLRESHLSQSFSKNSIDEVLNGFVLENINTINSLCKKLKYPPMKVLDMYFWQLGYNFDERKRRKGA